MEQIYTIPVNETFGEYMGHPECGCPMCRLHRRLEENELDRMLGAALMELDVRMETNRQGFCGTHYELMLARQNRLGLALLEESHLSALQKEIADTPLSHGGKRAVARIGDLESTCYICQRLEGFFAKMVETVVLLWANDETFPEKLKGQSCFCLPHYRMLLAYAEKRLSHKQMNEFAKDLGRVVESYLETLSNDVSWFVKKFDYRYTDEPWNNAKDAPDRATKFLRGDLHPHPGEFRKENGGLR